ncbi:MAG: PQQ-dependent sugar dehydrogenase [Acidobacteriota bacterium]
MRKQISTGLAAGLVFSLLLGLPGLGLAGGFGSLELVSVLPSLTVLVDIVHAGDERLFLAQQGGRILVWDRASAPTTFLDIGGLMGGGFEGGIKSIAFHPDYPNPGFFFVHYSDAGDDSVVARYRVSVGDPDVADPTSGRILLVVDQETDIHRGGQIGFGPDGFLYVGLGDGGPQTDPECKAQRADTLQGKLLRLDVDQNVDTPPYHGIPVDNPFGGVNEPRAEVWALGLRQPWRFSFDRANGDLYIADVGQNEREEVNYQPAAAGGGQNYGWRVMEGLSCFDPDPINSDCPATTPSCFDSAYTAPAFDYDQSNGDCSITGGYVYRGPAAPPLVGRYIYGDFCSGNLWAADNGGGTWSSTLLPISLSGVQAFGEDREGRLFATDGSTLFELRMSVIFADGFESGDTGGWSATQMRRGQRTRG